jgi:hypothetical protein
MGWVVKDVRFDLAEAIRADAERDARRVRRAAARTARDVAAELAVLEQLAGDLRRAVRRRRLATAASAPAPAARPGSVRAPSAHAAAAHPTSAAAGADPARRQIAPPAAAHSTATRNPSPRRGGRASMRSSPLAELFRATDARGPRRTAA